MFSGQPSACTRTACLAINSEDARWYSADCAQRKPYVCEEPALPEPMCPASPTCASTSVTCATPKEVTVPTCPACPAYPACPACNCPKCKPPPPCPQPKQKCSSGWTYLDGTDKCYKVRPFDNRLGLKTTIKTLHLILLQNKNRKTLILKKKQNNIFCIFPYKS